MDENRIDTFRQLLGTSVHVEEGAIDLKLTEIDELRHGAFSVLFEGPSEPVLSQSMYTFRTHDDATLSMFIVPLGPGADGAMVYEAVFTTAPPVEAG